MDGLPIAGTPRAYAWRMLDAPPPLSPLAASDRPEPLLAYGIDLCDYDGEPDFELIKLAPGEDAGTEVVPREHVVAWLRHIISAGNPAAEATTALEALMGPEDEE